MKTLYFLSKAMMIALILIYVFALFFYPVTMALFTTHGYASVQYFIRDLGDTFAVMTPVMAILILPFTELRSYAAYKLCYIDKRTFINRTYALVALEVVLVLGLFIWVMVTKYSMGLQLSSV